MFTCLERLVADVSQCVPTVAVPLDHLGPHYELRCDETCVETCTEVIMAHGTRLEKEVQKSLKRLGLQKWKLSPHSLGRHAGASHDAYHRIRTLAEIQKRGQWRTKASVNRYEKSAKLIRQIGRMSQEQQVVGRKAVATFLAKLLTSSGRLRQ